MINESHAASVKHISRFMAAAVIAFLLIICVFATSAFAGMASEYNVVIDDNGKQYTVTTNETEPTEILNEANIALGSNDRLDIAGFEAGNGGTIVIDRLNTVNIKFNESIKAYDVYADTVGEAFAELKINVSGCKLNYDVNDAVENGMEITVYRTVVKTETVSEDIKYSTQTKENASMTVGETKVETAGENGEKKVTYQVTYVNGEETSRVQLTSVTVKEPITEVKYVGTAAAGFEPNGVQSKNGFSVGQTISGKYTHYCPCAKCCGKSTGNTASGKKVYVGMPEPYYVACNWLPLGSVIDVDGQTYTVVDRGGSGLSKTGRIDIYTPGGHAAALSAGTGRCTITVLRLGW